MSFTFDTLSRAWALLQQQLPEEQRDCKVATRFGFLLEELHDANHRLNDAVNKDERVTALARRLESDLAAAPQQPAPTAATLYEAIKHGDDAHRTWLKEALEACFAGLPVPPPYPSTQPAPRKIQIPPPMAPAEDVIYAKGWNAACDAFFGGLPPQEPVIITVTETQPAPQPLTEEQRQAIWDEMVNTHGFAGEDTAQMVGHVIAATEAAHGITAPKGDA